jgi:hypothetical protein
MAPYLMNHYLRKYLIKMLCVLFYRRHHTFDVNTCFQQNRYVFDVIVTSWVLFVFCISLNFARDISTVFEEIKHLRSRAPDNIYKIIKINKTQPLLKYFFGARGVKFLEKRRENVQILQALRWRFDVWKAIFAVKNDGMSARNSYIT